VERIGRSNHRRDVEVPDREDSLAGSDPIAPNRYQYSENPLMAKTLTATDRKALIRLASTMLKGSPERRVILAGLSR